MARIIGIDLGTTNSVIAVMERGQPKVIPNTEGSRLTPSMVAFDEGGKVLIGEAARRRVLVDPETTVVSAKRFIGLGVNDPIVRRAPCKVVAAPGGDLAFEIFRVRHSPAEICARILTQLKRAAADYLGEPVTGAVISVPMSFNEHQRQAIRDAGAIAGLEIKRIINDPIAVALVWPSQDQGTTDRRLQHGRWRVRCLDSRCLDSRRQGRRERRRFWRQPPRR